MLLAEDLLLLLLDDQTGRPSVAGSRLDNALGGAVLAELAGLDLVATEPLGPLGGPRVVLVAMAAHADEVLVSGLEIVQQKKRAPADVVRRIARRLRPTLLNRLAEAGMLSHREDRVLMLFPRNRWLATDLAHQDALREEVRACLVRDQIPNERTAALVGLVWAVGHAHKVVPTVGRPARELKARAKLIGEGQWVAKAVKDAIAEDESSAASAAT